MVAASEASLAHEPSNRLDGHFISLKDKIDQLRKGLQHWQTWDAEYEALKEDVQALPQPATAEDLQHLQANFYGELLLERDIDEIFGQRKRSPQQIVNILDRRIDYVNQNVANLRTQLEKAELAHSETDSSHHQDAIDQDEPPITEILEELDDHDNVVSYRLNRPDDNLPRVRAALEKVGIDAPTIQASSSSEKTSISTVAPDPAPVQPVKEPVPPPPPAESQPVQHPTVPLSRIAKREDVVKNAKHQEQISHQPSILPDDEDPEDAALRRQMLKYSMGEMAAVVAEFNLEDGDDSDVFDSDICIEEDDEYVDLIDDDNDDDDDDEEDKYGRFTGRIITDKYQQRMLELETKLGVKSRFTRKKEQEAEEKDSDEECEGVGRIRIKQDPKSASVSSSAAPTKSIVKENNSSGRTSKKGVRFAQELDIAPEPEPTRAAAPEVAKGDTSDPVEVMSDLIVERVAAPQPAAPSPSAARKQSRFKRSVVGDAAQSAPAVLPKGPLDVPASFLAPRCEEERPIPTGPKGTTIAHTLVEKETVPRPADPADVDDAMLHMSVAEEHQRLRSRFIRRDGGGFFRENEDPVEPLEEMDGGGAERMSRFKAARLSRQ